MEIFPRNIGNPDDGDDFGNDEDSGIPTDLTEEEEELRDAIYRAVKSDGAHKNIDHLPDEEEEALDVLASTYIVSEAPYGNENGYNRNRFADVDESMGWFVIQNELGVSPMEKPSDELNGSPFSVNVDTEDFGFFDDHDGYGFRITVYYARHNEEGKFIGRRKGQTSLYPTFFRAAIAAVDVARDIKEDWFTR